MAKKDYTVGMNVQGMAIDDPDVMFYETFACGSERNYTNFCSPEMEKLFDGEATFHDSNNVRVETPGDPDAAGFVQVMTGQVSDPERAQALMANQPNMQDVRPDILGSVTVSLDDGKWTMIVYFRSEKEAREGEQKELSPEMMKAMEEMQSLSVGQPEFLDLKTPWMDSPEQD